MLKNYLPSIYVSIWVKIQSVFLNKRWPKNINKLRINYYSEIQLMSWNFIQKYLAETLGLNKYRVKLSSPEKWVVNVINIQIVLKYSKDFYFYFNSTPQATKIYAKSYALSDMFFLGAKNIFAKLKIYAKIWKKKSLS